MSTFVSHLENSLSLSLIPPNAPGGTSTPSPSQTLQVLAHSQTKESLRTFFLDLSPPTTLDSARAALTTLQEFEGDHVATLAGSEDDEEVGLRRAILGKIVAGLYVQSLNTFLEEASRADVELEWWNDVAHSKINLAMFLLQTLPGRVLNLSRTILRTLQSQGIPLHPSVLTPTSLRRLFPSTNVLRPNALTISLFPYLKYQPYAISLSHTPIPTTDKFSLEKEASTLFKHILSITQTIKTLFDFPLSLTLNECRFKRTELEKIRNERAEVLGGLADLRNVLKQALEEVNNEEGMVKLTLFASQMQGIVRGGSGDSLPPPPPPPILPTDTQTQPQSVLTTLYSFTYTTLPSHLTSHASRLSTHNLLRPSRLTLLWPKLVFIPPLVLYGLSSAYTSRASIQEMGNDIWETVKGFWDGWLVGPLKDVVKTVRAGESADEGGVIITRESVKSDLDSLERMTLSLARDKLGYTPEQMNALSQQIRVGDLTTVMQIYEDDIKTPLKSAIGGTLLRTLFVQVQKAKVDIDQALSGIDKLLKSQELTFAFVGVAPAFAIVYASFGLLNSLYEGGRGRGLYGGKKRRMRVWSDIRRIERLLISQPRHVNPIQSISQPHTIVSPTQAIPPLTSGLLLLSVTHLRNYAETCLPPNSRLRQGFLEDVEDLESSTLGRAEKLRVVDRMWRSWGKVLGWGRKGTIGV
ncbi:NCA2-domain-containing protein [Abortiporus biennis]|nr:NCA2-domain-containing protein [Abortiporus biennis]